jgi:hypothetical protein
MKLFGSLVTDMNMFDVVMTIEKSNLFVGHVRMRGRLRRGESIIDRKKKDVLEDW